MNGSSVQAGASGGGGGGGCCTQSCASSVSKQCKQCKLCNQVPVEELEVVVHPIINLQPFNSSHLQAAAHLGDKYAGC